ncbi:MAG: large-conductance mechanosensitive channel protein MscL [Oscillospiraceae bacterium]|nr:large-conductance mechanosensitive channel protein MscL [Oscillospiraceae bacterium]
MEKKGLIREFKAFISRGNVVDMAVGVIIGSAFTKIVNSLVNDVFMPALSVVTGGVNFADLKYVITPATEEVAEVAIKYGMFIQNIIDFLLIAIVVFAMVKFINKLRDAKKKEEEKPAEPAAPPPTPEDILLLREIRDSLKK